MADPRISIVVPVYNAEKHISECLDSIMAQTLKPAEVIVCDDASTDNSKQIIASYAKKYPHLIQYVFHNQNIGISKNFNSGLKKAAGNYVSLIAGDDYWLPEKLELEYKTMKVKKTQWVYSQVSVLEVKTNQKKMFWGTKNPLEGNIFKAVFSRELSPRNFLIKKQTIRAENYFDDQLELFEDWDLKIRLAKRYPIAHVPTPQIVYRLHSSGISRTALVCRLNQVLSVIKKNRHLLHNLDKKEIHYIKKKINAYYFSVFKSENRRSRIKSWHEYLLCLTYLFQLRFICF